MTENSLYVKITGQLDHRLIYDPLIIKSWSVLNRISRDVEGTIVGYNIQFRNKKDKLLFKLKYGL